MEENEIIWVCLACGKTSEDRYGKKNISHGWDESCFINAVQVKKIHLVYNLDESRVIEIKEEGITEKENKMESSFSTSIKKVVLIKTETGLIEKVVLRVSKDNLYVKLGSVGMGITGQEPWFECGRLEFIEVLD